MVVLAHLVGSSTAHQAGSTRSINLNSQSCGPAMLTSHHRDLICGHLDSSVLTMQYGRDHESQKSKAMHSIQHKCNRLIGVGLLGSYLFRTSEVHI